MDRVIFESAVENCLQRDERYSREAYLFVREALDHTCKALARSGSDPDGHVRGQELACGLRDYAIKEFGPLARTVLDQWGITRTDDVGEIVFALIEHGALRRSENDSREDFADVFSLADSLEAPFRPRKESRLPA